MKSRRRAKAGKKSKSPWAYDMGTFFTPRNTELKKAYKTRVK